MLKRFYADNFRCLKNVVLPGRSRFRAGAPGAEGLRRRTVAFGNHRPGLGTVSTRIVLLCEDRQTDGSVEIYHRLQTQIFDHRQKVTVGEQQRDPSSMQKEAMTTSMVLRTVNPFLRSLR